MQPPNSSRLGQRAPPVVCTGDPLVSVAGRWPSSRTPLAAFCPFGLQAYQRRRWLWLCTPTHQPHIKTLCPLASDGSCLPTAHPSGGLPLSCPDGGIWDLPARAPSGPSSPSALSLSESRARAPEEAERLRRGRK